MKNLKPVLLSLLMLMPAMAFANHGLEALAVLEYFFYFVVNSILALINFFICRSNVRKKKSSIRILTGIFLIIQLIFAMLCIRGLPPAAIVLLIFIIIQLRLIYKSTIDQENV